LETLLERLFVLPPLAVYGLVGALAAIENVFPPVPADTAVGFGAFLSHHGTVSAVGVFAVTWAANVASASAVYGAGRMVGRPFFTGRIGRRLLDPGRLGRIERLYRDHGLWGIFLSRFVPGVRAVVPPFAGIAGLGAIRAIVPIAAASAVWYGLLTIVIASMAGRIEDVVRLVTRLNWTLLTAALVAGGVAVILARHRRRTASRRGR
jgi:membrane protein DedA with SNARE-associated domain